ncbi:MAG TPA: DinB family protein [Azospirillaceae bacterium]|nr:DinB family protein [Azospirillaceae bacterium]
MTPAYFRTLARYNAWANRRLYAACTELPEAELKADRKAFFRSILGTLNHILVADRAWLGRLEYVQFQVSGLEAVLYEDFAALDMARRAEDDRIAIHVGRLDEASLAEDLNYRNMAGAEQRTPMAWVLAHLFNHQTHHRGQVHDMLSQMGREPPPLDLIYHIREVGPVT